MKKLLFISYLVTLLPVLTDAQFISGSTGADGALDLSTMTCQSHLCEVQLPESGVLNYTTVNVPNGKTLGFKRNSRNTPVIMLAQGSVTIAGTISVSASARFPGPGGFYGGQPNLPGLGPGGGTSNASPHGKWIGSLSLSSLVGGSGGFGAMCTSVSACDGGGGGGGILIASSTTITIPQNTFLNIRASGSIGDTFNARGSLGAGGAIRLIANSLNVSGGLFACNENQNPNFPPGPCGVVRLEALQGQLNFTGSSQPGATLVPFTAGSAPTISTNSLPQITIQSIGGYAVPSYAGSRFDTVDLLLPNQLPDPLNVVVNAVNIPVGTQVKVGFVSGSPSGASSPCNLSGTLASSSCTATISNLNRTGVTYLLATAVFTPPDSLARFNPKGENQVARIRLETVLGAKPKYVFLNRQDKVIDSTKISKEFLQYFGI